MITEPFVSIQSTEPLEYTVGAMRPTLSEEPRLQSFLPNKSNQSKQWNRLFRLSHSNQSNHSRVYGWGGVAIEIYNIEVLLYRYRNIYVYIYIYINIKYTSIQSIQIYKIY